jgi:hypothetical protein
MSEELEKYYEDKERQEALEHRDVLLAIGALIKTNEGQTLFQYLFKNFEVGNVPDRDLKGEELHEQLGFWRAGNSIYKLACEADSETTASIIAKTERKRYEELYELHRIKNGLNASKRANSGSSEDY